MVRFAFLMMPALLVAACSSEEPVANQGGAVANNEPLAELGAPTLVTPSPTATEAAVTTFPAEYRGRWGMVPNDCDPSRADAKGLMTVAADKLSFYESRATPRSITPAGPTAITADLAFTGEGQEWTQTSTLTLLDDGRTLTRTVDRQTLSYSRCPSTNA